jgi:phage-related protein
MAKKNEYQWFWDLMLLIGGIGLLSKLLKRVTETEPGQPGIYGPPHARKFIAYIRSDGKELFRRDLLKHGETQIKEFIMLLNDMSIVSEMGGHFKYMKGVEFSGELISPNCRIFVHQLDKYNWLALLPFIKRGNETPKDKIAEAEKRLREYLSRSRKS